MDYLIFLQLQVLDQKSKGSPTCCYEDCMQRKRDIESFTESVEDQSHRAQISSDKEQEQYNRETGAKYSSVQPPSNNNNNNGFLSNIRNSSPFSPATTPQQPLSLSPCQSCKSAQDLAETSAAQTSTNSSLQNCNGNWSSSDHSHDCGYSSENYNGCCDTASASSSLPSSPEGSEVACSDGFCNHEGNYGV
jgi:hypothetical protein